MEAVAATTGHFRLEKAGVGDRIYFAPWRDHHGEKSLGSSCVLFQPSSGGLRGTNVSTAEGTVFSVTAI